MSRNTLSAAGKQDAALSIVESKSLSSLEQVIERGQKTFIEVGKALLAIQEQKLYRQDYGKFAEYCNDRWGFAKSRAYQMIDAAKVVENVHNCVQTIDPPKNESQARPLASLPADQQANAWAEVVDECKERGEPITAAAVEDVVERYKAQTEPYVDDDDDDDDDEPAKVPKMPKLEPFDFDLESSLVYSWNLSQWDKWPATSRNALSKLYLQLSNEASPCMVPESAAARAAAIVGVPVENVHRASRILDSGNVAIIAAVERGDIGLDEAENILQTTSAPRSVTICAKTYEIQQAHGFWDFRVSPDAGWTACSKEMIGLIEQEGKSHE